MGATVVGDKKLTVTIVFSVIETHLMVVVIPVKCQVKFIEEEAFGFLRVPFCLLALADHRYLKYCLRSIAKLCAGFRECKVMVPNSDLDECRKLLDGWPLGTLPFAYEGFDEWPDKGMLHHMYHILNSDILCQGDLVLHTDSDCVFTKPVTPQSFMVDGKPILYYAAFKWLLKEHPGVQAWQFAVTQALGWEPKHEFMRRHPAVHYRGIYKKTRQMIEARHGCSLESYMKKQRNAFPQSFAEFPTLGEIAWKFFHDKYHWIDQQRHGVDKSLIHQAWGHREPVPEDVKIYKNLGNLLTWNP